MIRFIGIDRTALLRITGAWLLLTAGCGIDVGVGSTTGSTGTGGPCNSGTGGADTSGSGGASMSGTGGAETAGSGGASMSGTGGADTSGAGGIWMSGTGGADTSGAGGASLVPCPNEPCNDGEICIHASGGPAPGTMSSYCQAVPAECKPALDCSCLLSYCMCSGAFPQPCSPDVTVTCTQVDGVPSISCESP
ncbi:MAG: hypothetical protein U0359_22455 [Byssovorax sp.]